MNSNSEYDYLFKIILIGNSGVGKTCFLKRYTEHIFLDDYVSTIGVDFKIKTLEIENKKCKLQLWDTAGQERFNSITQSYYRGSHGIVVLFDLTNQDSFKDLENWLKKIEENASQNKETIILGNKVDLKDKIEVKREDVLNLMKKWNIKETDYYEVSAKDDIRVNEVFENLTKILIDKQQRGSFVSKDKSKIDLEAVTTNKCC